MGFFKDIGNGLSNAVKSVTKSISTKNLINVATGNAGAVLNEVKDRLVSSGKDATKNIANGVIKKTAGGMPPSSGGLKPPKVTASQIVKAPAKAQFNLVKASVKPNLFVKAPANLQSKSTVDTILDVLGGKIDEKVDKVKQKIYAKPEVKSVMDLLKKEAIGYYWKEYKTRIILGSLSIFGLGVWYFKYRKPSNGRKRK